MPFSDPCCELWRWQSFVGTGRHIAASYTVQRPLPGHLGQALHARARLAFLDAPGHDVICDEGAHPGEVCGTQLWVLVTLVVR